MERAQASLPQEAVGAQSQRGYVVGRRRCDLGRQIKQLPGPMCECVAFPSSGSVVEWLDRFMTTLVHRVVSFELMFVVTTFFFLFLSLFFLLFMSRHHFHVDIQVFAFSTVCHLHRFMTDGWLASPLCDRGKTKFNLCIVNC